VHRTVAEPAPAAAGHAEDGIEPPESPDGRADDPVRGVVLEQVRDLVRGLATGSDERSDQVSAVGLGARCDDDAGTFVDEPSGRRRGDPRRSRDEARHSVEPLQHHAARC
jgi:hypothetical protein